MTTSPTKVDLPAAQFPLLKLMLTDNLAPTSADAEIAVPWRLGEPHPYAPTVRVRRMFIGNGGVEVYSAADDGEDCTRDLIPMNRIRITQEVMPLPVFIEELALAEAGEPDDDDPDDDPEPEQDPPPLLANGQAAS